jgi:hypothetical protein
MYDSVTLPRRDADRIGGLLLLLREYLTSAIADNVPAGQLWPTEDWMRPIIAQDRRDLLLVNQMLKRL